MKLGDGVEQAIHGVLLLSGLRPDGALPAAALAEFLGVSTSYLLKHLQTLVGAGVLLSVPGPRGGYRLARPPEDITLLDIVLAIEGVAPAFRCTELRRRGPDPLPPELFTEPCHISVAMLNAEQVYRDELRKVRVADLRGDPATPLGAALLRRSQAFLARHERRPPAQ